MNYDTYEMLRSYESLEHGKPRIICLKEAIRVADEQNDIPYQIFFRSELCHESAFYENGLDLVLTFPEMAALVDQYPDAPCAEESMYGTNVRTVLWQYKWLLEHCKEYYQISKKDWFSFLEDFKHRCIAHNYNLRVYYMFLYDFGYEVDDPKADDYLHMAERLPRTNICDCKACERNEIIYFYLKHHDYEKATQLAKDIESGVLFCEEGESYFRLQKNYLMHYLYDVKNYEKAGEYLKRLERFCCQKKEFDIYDDELRYYSYYNSSKAFKIYKENWKRWLLEKNPRNSYNFGKTCCVFFKRLMLQRKQQTVKIAYDASFPLYRETNTYQISELYDFYYKFTEKLATKFDTRNETTSYYQKLQDAIHQAEQHPQPKKLEHTTV